MEYTKVTNKEALNFLNTFFLHRSINKKYFSLVPEDSYDYRMVDTTVRKSDSPRESLAHHINVENTYIHGIKTGVLQFGASNNKHLVTLSKKDLLKRLDEADLNLIELLSEDLNVHKIVSVPWNKNGVKAIDMLWSMNSHEILHTGWNLAVMDHLNIERFHELKKIWG